jgi:thiol-disulfide isomerase/thioredoxin|tara:strand:+ start:12491 stop:13084 length:594 start_codon:yes stop_codon:yes gene_type:complete
MKNFKLLSLLFVLASTGCSACTNQLESDSSDVVTEPYPWATWEECSQKIDDHPCNFSLQDQNGEEVSLYDYYGGPIILDFSVMWCGPCQSAAAEVQQVQDSHASDGLTYITVLIETAEGVAPTVEDCKSWADDFGITSVPVLAGSRDMIDYSAIYGWNIESWPTFYFITEDMKIHTSLRGYSASYIEQLLNDTMNSD